MLAQDLSFNPLAVVDNIEILAPKVTKLKLGRTLVWGKGLYCRHVRSAMFRAFRVNCVALSHVFCTLFLSALASHLAGDMLILQMV